MKDNLLINEGNPRLEEDGKQIILIERKKKITTAGSC